MGSSKSHRLTRNYTKHYHEVRTTQQNKPSKIAKMAKCIYNLDVSESLRYFLGVVNILQGIASTLGNIVVFAVVLSNKRLWTRSNAFLLSLATSDFLVGVLLEPMFVAQFFSRDRREDCRFNMIRRYLSTLLMGGAVGSIALVSYDRWTHLTKTISYKTFMPKKKVAILITIAWVIPIVIPLVRLTSEAVYSAIIIIYLSLVLALMTTCYIVIVKIVRSRTFNVKQRSDQKRLDKSTSDHIRVAKAIVLIILCLLVTIMPVCIYHGVTSVNGLSPGLIHISDNTKEICYAVLMTIGLANSGINPVIYYFRIPEFRSSMKRLFGRIRGTGNSKDYSCPRDDSTQTSL